MPETTTIIPDRLARFLDPGVHLRLGVGSGANGRIDVCAVQAADWLAGGDGKSDRPECVCPVIGRYVTRLNDSRLFRDHRDLLKPYCPRLVGTRSTPGVVMRRAFVAADRTVRAIGPEWLRASGRDEWAAELEAVPAIVDRATAAGAREVALKVRSAAYTAATTAAASAEAVVAYAFAATISATADAAYSSADESVAAESAAYAVAATIVRARALECLDAMIAAGPVGAAGGTGS